MAKPSYGKFVSEKVARACLSAMIAAVTAGSGCGLLGVRGIPTCDEKSSEGGTWVRVEDGRCCFYKTDPGHRSTHDELLNACTPAACVAFENDRLPPGWKNVDAKIQADKNYTFGEDECGLPQPISTCSSASGPNPPNACPDDGLYVTGSNAIYPVLEVMGQAIAVETQRPLVYFSQSSCDGVLMTFQQQIIQDKAAVYWDASGGPKDCTQSKIPHIAVSDTSATMCTLIKQNDKSVVLTPDVLAAIKNQDKPLSTAIAENMSLGPVQAMIFIQPPTAVEGHVISQEAFYHVFGLSNLPPWQNDCHIMRRNYTSGTLNVIAQDLGVVPEFFKGREMGCTDMMLAAMKSGAADDGIMASEVIGIYDVINAERDKAEGLVRALAFQARGQSCGYWPDSRIGAHDKGNVRDGHYVIWDNLHVYYNPASLDVAVHVPLIAANNLPGSSRKAMLSSIIQGALVPQCAMKVRWLTDPDDPRVRSLLPFDPRNRVVCNCFYDLVTTGAAACSQCNREGDPCTTTGQAEGTCNFGFCEPNERWPDEDAALASSN